MQEVEFDVLTVRKNLRAVIDSRFSSQEAFGRAVGVSQGAVSQWLKSSCPSMVSIRKIANAMNLSLEDLISDDKGFYAQLHGLTGAPAGAIAPAASTSAFLPLRGRVHAGEPSEPEQLDGMVELPATVAANHPNAYFLTVEGDCMDKAYPEGCHVLVDPDREPQNSSIAAVMIDGAECVMRRLYRGADVLMLSPESSNPKHRDIVVRKGDGRTVELVGTVVWFQPKEEMI